MTKTLATRLAEAKQQAAAASNRGMAVLYEWEGETYDGSPFAADSKRLTAEEVAALKAGCDLVIVVKRYDDWGKPTEHEHVKEARNAED